MVILVAAAGENNELGKNNDLLWHLPDDFRHFKTLTTGQYIIMGRKTFESFPKPLPNRVHIIITRQTNYHPEGSIIAKSIEEAISHVPDRKDAFVIGGGEIYNLAIPLADRIELTKVHQSFDADAFFPTINPAEWKTVREEFHPKDEKHLYDFTFVTLDRISQTI